jgi:hypothetical protein
LYDDFAYKGEWWLPGGKRSKVKGELVVTAGESIRLDIFGDFKRRKSPPHFLGVNQNPPVIHGDTDAGPVTLLDSLFSTGHQTHRGNARTTYQANLCLFGAWFDGRDDVRFNSLKLRFTHLEWWWATHPFTSQYVRDGEKVTGFTMTYTYPPGVRVEVPSPKVVVGLDAELNQRESFADSAHFTHYINVRVTPDRGVGLDEAFRLLSDLQKFFILLVGEQVFVRSFEGAVTAKELVAVKPRATRKVCAPCAVFFSQLEQRPADKSRSHNMIFPANVLGDRATPVLLKWFESLENMRPVYEVFFGTFRASRMFSESRFLHLSQALESFHRRTIGGVYEPDAAKYKVIKDAMIAAIPAGIDGALRQRLKSQVHYGNEPSLRKRLTGLFKTLSEAEVRVICEDTDEFVNAVVGTRNYLTHLDESSRDIVLEGHDRFVAIQKLELLLTVLLLKHLGLPGEEVLGRIEQCGRFDTSPFRLHHERGRTV